jgi:hypothetical protein
LQANKRGARYRSYIVTSRSARTASTRVTRILLGMAALAVLAGLGLLWGARIAADRFVYVSELGADGEPTAWAFRWALLLIAGAALVVAGAARELRSRLRPLALFTPSFSLVVAAAAFAFASQVTCTSGCPLPVGAAFTWQDLLHTAVAVLGFAAACVAMLQVATARNHPGLAKLSLLSAIGVAVVAGAGGILSLARVLVDLGGILEFVATTLALLWLAALAVALFVGIGRESPATSPTSFEPGTAQTGEQIHVAE